MKFPKFFKLTNWKRLLILGFTLIATVVVIILGSLFYVGKNPKKSIEYGGGQEYVVQIQTGAGKSLNDKSLATDVAQSIYERIDALGVGGAEVEVGENAEGSTVRVSYPGLTTQKEKDDLKELITHKPHLSFTDIYGNTIFDKRGNFNSHLTPGQDPQGALVDPTTMDWKVDARVPLAEGGSKSIFTAEGKHEVQITLDSERAATEWTRATSYISSLPSGKNVVLAWLDVNEYVRDAKNWPELWPSQGNLDLYAFAHVDNDVSKPLRSNTVDASKYLISSASVQSPLNGRDFVLSGNFNAEQASALARKLNYGSANYQLSFLSSADVQATYGSNAFEKAMIAGILVFSIIAIFLIANYGLLGALSTISIALYMFLTLLLFTVMRGEYSPETIAALIIGVGMSVDANIITFERLKMEVYTGSSIKKAHSWANKTSLSAIFDANITTLIIAFVLFYFGTRNIVGLSVTLIISIFFTLLIMLAFTRFLSTLLIKTGYFDKRMYLLGVKPKFDTKIQTILNKPDYIKWAKPFSIASGIIIIASVIVFTITAAVAGNIVGGINLSQEFTGGTQISVQKQDRTNAPEIKENEVRQVLIDSGVEADDIQTIYAVNGANTPLVVKEIKVDTRDTINLTKLNSDSNLKNYKVLANTTSNATAQQIVRDAMYAILIAMALIVLYTLVRFKWTYSVAAIIALVHDGLIVTAVFIITRVEMSPVFIAGLLSILGYSINDTIVTFDRVRERMKTHIGKLDRAKIRSLANEAIKDTLKRSLLTSITTILAIVVLMCFGNATKLSFNLAMLVGLVAGTYSSIFIATYVWVGLESIRQNGITKREKSQFWKTKGREEQTFKGINDFQS